MSTSNEKDRREHERYDPWERLVEQSDAGVAQGRATVARVARSVLDEPGESSQVVLGAREAGPALERFLAGLEERLAELCSRYDYRQFFLFSRLCLNLPVFRSKERTTHRTQARGMAADLCALRLGNRSLGDFTRVEEGGYSLGHPPDAIARDAVELHELAASHRTTVVELIRLNFLRLFAGENGKRHSPRLELSADGGMVVQAGSGVAEAAEGLFGHRYTYNRLLSRWGVGELVSTEGYPLSLMCEYSPKTEAGPYGGVPFVPRPMWANEFLEHLKTFPELLDERVGLPPEHLYAILRALYKLATDTGLADGGRLERWMYLTGTMLLPKEGLLGGRLEALAGEYVGELGLAHAGGSGLDESIGRFVGIFASKKIPEGEIGAARPTEEVLSLRTLWPPYLFHGEEAHQTWVVDFASTMPVLQRVADLMEVSDKGQTTGSADHDADVRTSSFDRRLAEYLRESRGVKGASFPDRLAKKGPPNILFRFENGSDEQEIDVPLRKGSVLVAVQTWASEADKRIEAGDYEALRERWRKIRRKLKRTDERYADEVIADPATRRYLVRKGIRYVLPVLCSPFAEPVVSAGDKYWLRPISGVPAEAVPLALPRIATPPELGPYLDQVTESELRRVCERNGWRLQRG